MIDDEHLGQFKEVPKVIYGINDLITLCVYDLMNGNIHEKKERIECIKHLLMCCNLLSQNLEFTNNYVYS